MKVPKECPFCGSNLPGEDLQSTRVFYSCGLSMSIDKQNVILAKNCTISNHDSLFSSDGYNWYHEYDRAFKGEHDATVS